MYKIILLINILLDLSVFIPGPIGTVSSIGRLKRFLRTLEGYAYNELFFNVYPNSDIFLEKIRISSPDEILKLIRILFS